MLHKSTLDFAKDLARNNSKAWGAAHRECLNAAREDLLALGKVLIDQAEEYDPEIAQAGIEALHLTRYNRDPRFLHGKPPYRTDLDLFFNAGAGTERVGYYLHVEPGNCHAGASLFIPSPSALARVRDLIASRTEEWNSVISAKSFVTAFPNGVEPHDELKTAPRGYDVDHPAIAFLRMKGLGTRAKLTEAEVCADDLIDRLIPVFRAVEPMVTFLNTGA